MMRNNDDTTRGRKKRFIMTLIAGSIMMLIGFILLVPSTIDYANSASTPTGKIISHSQIRHGKSLKIHTIIEYKGAILDSKDMKYGGVKDPANPDGTITLSILNNGDIAITKSIRSHQLGGLILVAFSSVMLGTSFYSREKKLKQL